MLDSKESLASLTTLAAEMEITTDSPPASPPTPKLTKAQQSQPSPDIFDMLEEEAPSLEKVFPPD